MDRSEYQLGLYEKALPDDMCWLDRLSLVRQFGFDYLEISIDESDFRLQRLHDVEEIREIRQAIDDTGVPISSLCLSGQRKFPLGSHDEIIRQKSLELFNAALKFAGKIGVQMIQVAGYDVYYEPSDAMSQFYFAENLVYCVRQAAQTGILLGFETMETPFMDTVEKAMVYVRQNESPYLDVYPDLGNLHNASLLYQKSWVDDIKLGRGKIIAAHLKDTKPGIYRNLDFGEGQVDFLQGIQTLWDLGVRRFTCEFWAQVNRDYQTSLNHNHTFVRNLFDKL